jgi:hypothetical protein
MMEMNGLAKYIGLGDKMTNILTNKEIKKRFMDADLKAIRL